MKKQNRIVKEIVEKLGIEEQVVIKEILIGKGQELNAYVIYIDGQGDTEVINRDILKPLMFRINEKLELEDGLPQYLCKKYIPSSDTKVMNNIEEVSQSVREGNTVIIIEYIENYIIVNTIDGEYRSISDPINEYTVNGTREGFVENIQTNVSILTRRIKEKNLTIEKFKVGKRSQTNLSLLYLKELTKEETLNSVREKIQKIDVDFVNSSGILQQYIEGSTYSIFPQIYITERPDIVEANLMDGKIAIIMSGVSHVLIVPCLFIEFFQGVEDYNYRFVVANFTRILRFMAIMVIITLPSIYLTLIKFNVELIPLQFIIPIAQSRVGIALPPFFEILSMEIIVELLREGGIRLPAKIAQTISIVGGIIIGDTAIRAKIVSPTTLLIIGVTVIATFMIPNYEMSLSIRFLRFPILVLANFMGIFGIAIGWFLIIAHLYRLDSFGTPYFSLNTEDLKDMFIRFPMWKMKTRPKDIAGKDKIRQGYFRDKFRSKKNE